MGGREWTQMLMLFSRGVFWLRRADGRGGRGEGVLHTAV